MRGPLRDDSFGDGRELPKFEDSRVRVLLWVPEYKEFNFLIDQEIAYEELYVHVGTMPKLVDTIEAVLQIIFDRCCARTSKKNLCEMLLIFKNLENSPFLFSIQ
mmetsp:Transcript_24783/g.65161  ORF Transcript_24783/g.65161 Transcript_24783/m.65161 type:complete len:104 (-) Transcript_24783:537-848(-)